MTHLATLDDWDSDGINKKIQCDCDKGEDHHALDGPMPSPIQPWTVLNAGDQRKVGEWLDEFRKTLPVTTELAHLGQLVDWRAEFTRLQEIIDRAHPRRAEPIKLTPGQWAMLPRGTPTPCPLYQPLGDLMGIPVVMVDSEAESTPVVEGWIKPKRRESRKERRKRLGLHWWQRGGR